MSKTKEVYGKISLSWSGNVLLPLEQAHKVQQILAQYGVGFGEAYRSDIPNIRYIMEYKVPDVTVSALPTYDCTALTDDQRRDWEESVRTSADESFFTPQEFVALRGEQQ